MLTKPNKMPVAQRDDPRRTFETAISQLQQEAVISPSQSPIVARQRTFTRDSAAEKQVLTNAARALARLWNVAPAPIRR